MPRYTDYSVSGHDFLEAFVGNWVARAFFQSLPGINLTVSVEVGTEVPMAAHAAAGVIHQEGFDEYL